MKWSIVCLFSLCSTVHLELIVPGQVRNSCHLSVYHQLLNYKWLLKSRATHALVSWSLVCQNLVDCFVLLESATLCHTFKAVPFYKRTEQFVLNLKSNSLEIKNVE